MITLHFSDFEPVHSYHAALVSMRPNGNVEQQLHDHSDFAEFMLVTRGEGVHHVNGKVISLVRGTLTLVRPGDRHVILPAASESIEFINVAFPTNLAFRILEVGGANPARWFDGSLVPHVHLERDRLAELEASYTAGLRRHHDGPPPLELTRLLADSFSAWPTTAQSAPHIPIWLQHALRRMLDEEALREGMPALRSLTRVSQSHLSRELRRHTGQTPSQWLTATRIRLAMSLLATTTESVENIAFRVGFDSNSYFGKRFRSEAGMTASDYRRRRSAAVLGASAHDRGRTESDGRATADEGA